MYVINFSHPLTPAQTAQLADKLGETPEDVRTVKVQFDVNVDFVSQTMALIDGLAAIDWASVTLVIVAPALSAIALTLCAALHGRMGHFPAIVRLRTVPGAVTTEFEIAEIINLDQVRQTARSMR